MQCTHSAQYTRIAVWDPLREDSPGDEVVVSALIRALEVRQPQAEIVVLSPDPDFARSHRGTHAWSSRAGEPQQLWRAYKRLSSCDLLVVVGSHPFREGSGELYRWTALARLAQTPVHMLSLGTASLDASGISRYAARRALDAAAYVSFRDAHSQGLAGELGLRRHCPVVPDLAFGIEQEPCASGRQGPLVVGVNPEFVATQGIEACVRKQMGFMGWLLAERHDVRLFHTTSGDLRVCEALEAQLRDEGLLRGDRTLLHAEALRPGRIRDELRRCDIVIAAGFHCILLPALAGIPVVGLAHQSHARDLLAHLGQEGFAADIDRFGTPQLVDSFCTLRANAARAREQLESRIPACRQAVRAQYDDLYGPVVAA